MLLCKKYFKFLVPPVRQPVPAGVQGGRDFQYPVLTACFSLTAGF
jgi:hypothetical protein